MMTVDDDDDDGDDDDDDDTIPVMLSWAEKLC